MNATTTAPRTLRILYRSGRTLFVTITDRTRRSGQATSYTVSPVATDFGTAWAWEHLGGPKCGKVYVTDPSAQTCTCKHGQHRHGGKRCRHLSALAQLGKRGAL